MQNTMLPKNNTIDATVDLNTVSKAIDAMCTTLQTDLSTVMGPEDAQSSQTASELLKKLEQTFKTSKDGRKSEKWFSSGFLF